ncbi:MAG: hypothetical protein ACKVS5_15705 [Parvularculaceae bacterium]
MPKLPDLRNVAAALALLAAPGCLTSETPLFNAGNAAAAPMADGRWRGCSHDENLESPDCKSVSVRRNAVGLYSLDIEGETDLTFARFRKIGAGVYSAQLWGASDAEPFYFLATQKGAALTLSMIDCAGLPAAFKRARERRGDFDGVEETTCTAKSVAAVDAAARAWRRTRASRDGPRVVYTPAT